MKSRTSRMLPIAFGIAAMTTGSTQLLAADAAPTSAAPTQGFQIEEVVITAEKVQESQQNVPISVAAFTAKDLQNDVVLKVNDLGEHVSGLVVVNNPRGNRPDFSIRATKTGQGVDGGIAVYFNDVPLANSTAVAGSFYDISSVEVLKGPQGTLFGVNTTGGAISFRFNKPTDKFEGYADVGIGNYNRQEFEGMINVPVNDVLQLRLAGNSIRRDGYTKNLTPQGGQPSKLNDEKHDSLRFSARLKPNSSITNDFVADYFNENQAGQANIPTAFTAGTLAYAAANGINLGFVKGTNHWNTVSTGGNPTGVNLPIFAKATEWGAQDAFNMDVNDNVGIKNVIGYRHDVIDTSQDDDGTPINLVNGRDRYTYEEWVDDFTLKLNTDDKRLRVISGVYLSHTEQNLDTTYSVAQSLLPFNLGIENGSRQDRVFRSHALYSQAEYDLTKELTVTLGLRYTWDEGNYLDQEYKGYSFPAPGAPFGTRPGLSCSLPSLNGLHGINPANCTGTLSHKWQAPSYNFVISDKFAEKSMIYFKASGSYIQGGFNTGIREVQYQTFEPEKADEFDIGIKSDWELWGRPIRTNIDVFYGDISNKQQNTNGSYADGTTWTANFNAGSLNYYGTDMEVKFYPVDALELSSTWTHIEANFTNFEFPAVGTFAAQNLTGAPPAQIPKDSLTLGMSYTWPLASSVGKLSSAISAYYRSKITFQDVAQSGPGLPTDGNIGPAYWTYSFSTNWDHIMGSNFDASFWVKNLFDKYYITYYNEQPSLGYAQVARGDPRMLGAHLRYNF